MKPLENPGVLTRETFVRVIDVSASGCLVESRRRIEPGTIGRLRLRLGNTECADDFEVVRCQAVGTSRSLYHVGVRFLWTSPRHAGSIRHALSQHLAELDQPGPTRVM